MSVSNTVAFNERPGTTSAIFSVPHVQRALKNSHEQVSSSAPIFLAAVLELVTTQILRAARKRSADDLHEEVGESIHELTEEARPRKKKRIHPKHIEQTLLGNSEMNKLVKKVVHGKVSQRNHVKRKLDALKNEPDIDLRKHGRGDEKSVCYIDSGDRSFSTRVTCASPCSAGSHLPPSATSSKCTSCPGFGSPTPSLGLKHDTTNMDDQTHYGVVLLITGLPGSYSGDFFGRLHEQTSDNPLKNTLRIRVLRQSKIIALLNAQVQSPVQFSLALHMYELLSCIQTIDNCLCVAGGSPSTLCITDACPMVALGGALYDYRKKHISDEQMSVYSQCFRDLNSTVGSSLGIKERSSVVTMFILSEPLACFKKLRQNLQMGLGGSKGACIPGPAFKAAQTYSLSHLECLNGIYFELILKQCACRNVLIIPDRLVDHPDVIIRRIAAIKSGTMQLPIVQFIECHNIFVPEPSSLKDSRPWISVCDEVVYDDDDVMFESYHDLRNGQWKPFEWENIVDSSEGLPCLKHVYVNKRFWIMRSAHIIKVLLEHLARGQCIYIF